VVIALAVLAILATTVLSSNVRILKAGDKARRMEELRFLACRVATETWLGKSPIEAIADDMDGWRVEFTPVHTGEGTNRIVWYRWEIEPSNSVSRPMVCHLRADTGGRVSRSGAASMNR
jgi:hypothetical protein